MASCCVYSQAALFKPTKSFWLIYISQWAKEKNPLRFSCVSANQQLINALIMTLNFFFILSVESFIRSVEGFNKHPRRNTKKTCTHTQHLLFYENPGLRLTFAEQHLSLRHTVNSASVFFCVLIRNFNKLSTAALLFWFCFGFVSVLVIWFVQHKKNKFKFIIE